MDIGGNRRDDMIDCAFPSRHLNVMKTDPSWKQHVYVSRSNEAACIIDYAETAEAAHVLNTRYSVRLQWLDGRLTNCFCSVLFTWSDNELNASRRHSKLVHSSTLSARWHAVVSRACDPNALVSSLDFGTYAQVVTVTPLERVTECAKCRQLGYCSKQPCVQPNRRQ